MLNYFIMDQFGFKLTSECTALTSYIILQYSVTNLHKTLYIPDDGPMWLKQVDFHKNMK
jgi:hypothetical protein